MTAVPFIKHVTYKNYAGGVVRGNVKWTTPDNKLLHITRAFWLASHVEVNGVFGTCQNYDGSGMTASLTQNVAVLHEADKQGSLFGILDRFRDDPQIANTISMKAMLDKFDSVGWMLDPNGLLRQKTNGLLVPAHAIVSQLSPPNGTVPGTGPDWNQCREWLSLFYCLFSDPATFKMQIKLGQARLASLDKAEDAVYYAMFGVHNPSVLIAGQNPLRLDQDLALCVYHAHSVNAPSVARKVLVDSNPDCSHEWPRKFLKMLDQTQYGNWAKRWTKTRIIAMNSGLWPEELFDGPDEIMPE